MPTLQRQDLSKLLDRITRGGEIAPVYLLVGERYLCREAADKISAALLPDERERRQRLTVIDGEREDPARTLAALRTYSLFGGRQLLEVVDSRIFLSKTVAKTLWEKAEKVRENGGDSDKEATRLLLTMLQSVDITPTEGPNDALAELSATEWQKLFGFSKPSDTAWAETLLAELEPSKQPSANGGGKTDAAGAYMAAIEAGLPPGNILLLLAETADKRKKLYKFLEKNAVIINLSVDTGSSAPARKEQAALLKDLAQQTLAGLGKKIRPDALELLLERVGFYPVAVVMEAEKLALAIGEEELITRREVDAMVGRTREEAIFELSEAYSSGNLVQALTILGRLQQGGGMHPLAVLGGLRNHVRKLLLARAVQDLAGRLCEPSLAFPVFQKSYLPQAQAGWEQNPDRPWPPSFPGHPYALYQLFRQAARLPAARLQGMLADLLQAEYRLKGSGLPESAVLSALLFRGK